MKNQIEIETLAGGFINSVEAGKRLGLSRKRIFQFIKEQRLPAVKVGRDWLIDPEDLKLVQDRKPGRPKKVEKPKELISVRDTARRLHTTQKEIQRLIKRGELRVEQDSNDVWMIDLESLNKYLMKAI